MFIENTSLQGTFKNIQGVFTQNVVYKEIFDTHTNSQIQHEDFLHLGNDNNVSPDEKYPDEEKDSILSENKYNETLRESSPDDYHSDEEKDDMLSDFENNVSDSDNNESDFSYNPDDNHYIEPPEHLLPVNRNLQPVRRGDRFIHRGKLEIDSDSEDQD